MKLPCVSACAEASGHACFPWKFIPQASSGYCQSLHLFVSSGKDPVDETLARKEDYREHWPLK